MEHIIHYLLVATPLVLAGVWFVVIDRSLEADRQVCKARKEKRDRVCRCN